MLFITIDFKITLRLYHLYKNSQNKTLRFIVKQRVFIKTIVLFFISSFILSYKILDTILQIVLSLPEAA